MANTNNTKSPSNDLSAVYDIPLEVTAVLGKTKMRISELLKLGQGAVVELDKKVGEPVDIKINEKLVARGEIVLVEDKVGITLTELIRDEQ